MAKRATKAKPKAKSGKRIETPAEEPKRTYEDVAQRAVAAFEEVNAAMKEAAARPDMMIKCERIDVKPPMLLQYQIFKCTHYSQVWVVRPEKKKIMAEYVGQVRGPLDEIAKAS